MNKGNYVSAMGKIKADDGFKLSLQYITAQPRQIAHGKFRRFIPAFAVVAIVIAIGTVAFTLLKEYSPLLLQKQGENSLVSSAVPKPGSDFVITGTYDNPMVDYIVMLSLDGYIYTQSSWYSYDRTGGTKTEIEALKGEKLGEETLDLKGKRYTGTPPDFSGTYDAGSEVFAVKGLKKQYAVIIVTKDGFSTLLYRSGRIVMYKNTPIGLTVAQVFSMLATQPKVTGVELRDSHAGAWLRTSQDKELLTLIEKQLPSQQLQTMDYTKINSDSGIHFNLMFADGAKLTITVFLKEKFAAVFGGKINLSDELCNAFNNVHKQSSEYKSITEMLQYSSSDTINYLYIKNETNGDVLDSKSPKWASSGLYDMISYYRVAQVKPETENKLVLTCKIGQTQENNKTLLFYEQTNKDIVVELDGKLYKPVKGSISFEDIESWLYNGTELGLKK